MPTWAAESWVDSARSDGRTLRALLSPASAALLTLDRSSETRENSAVTNNAVPIVSSTPTPVSSHSVIVGTS